MIPKKYIAHIGCLTVLLCLVLYSFVYSSNILDRNLALSDLPAAVQRTILSHMELESIDLIKFDQISGILRIRVEYTLDTHEKVMLLTHDGSVLSINDKHTFNVGPN